LNTSPIRDLLSDTPSKNLVAEISERLSQELVVALVGPIGSGVSTAAGFIHDILKNEFGYTVFPIIKPSDIIRAEIHRVGMSEIARSPLDAYVNHMQTAGNKLREKFGSNYLAEKTVEAIYKHRKADGGIDDNGTLRPGRRAYIIDSLKNLEELALLKQIYGETLCIFGVFAPDELRVERLRNNGAAEAEIKKIIDRDQGEVATFGQKTRKLFVNSDFFLCNDRKIDEIRIRLLRYLDITFNTSLHTPTTAESAIYKASAAAANSACMSRQVGAAIVSKSGELISIGWNDVPRFGGGLYGEDHQFLWDDEQKGLVDKDHRCFKWGRKNCHNETRRNDIINDLIKRMTDSKIVKRGVKHEDINKILAGTAIDSLIEFSRAIHAEMEAIVAVAREGKHSLLGSTLYTTTYPCHNCARHIVASGISTVIYIEPYQKSLATALHSDSVTENPGNRSSVVFRQYDGVAPRNYLRLFTAQANRKKNAHLVQTPRTSALPIFRVPLDAPIEYESKVIADLSDKEKP